MELLRDLWEGSVATLSDIQQLRRTRHILDGVECRLAGSEVASVAGLDEEVIFLTQFERGLGLPVSDFLWDFLDFFGLHSHHLPANA
jgi:hypothetical protein